MVAAGETVSKRSIANAVRVVAAMVLTAVTVFLTAALAGVQLFGLTVYAVPPGIAWENYRAGDLLYFSGRAVEKLQPGDTVVYVAGDTPSLRLGTVASVEQTQVLLYVGDGGEQAVAVAEGYLAGVAVASLPWLGYALFCLRSVFGRRLVCLLIGGVLLWLLLPEKRQEAPRVCGMFKKYSQTRRPF